MSLQALAAAFQGIRTVAQSAVDPKAAGEDAAKFLLAASLATTTAETFGKASLSGVEDFRAKFLNGLKES